MRLGLSSSPSGWCSSSRKGSEPVVFGGIAGWWLQWEHIPLMYAYGLPPPSETIVAGNVATARQHLAASAASQAPVVQVVWIDRNAFKPNRLPYEFEAVAPVTRLKRFKTAAACVKWLNDRQKRAGCNQPAVAAAAATERKCKDVLDSASSKSCLDKIHNSPPPNVIFSTPTSHTRSMSCKSSTISAALGRGSNSGSYPTLVCRVATATAAAAAAGESFPEDDPLRRVDLRLVVSAREAKLLLSCLSVEGGEEAHAVGGSVFSRRCIVPPKPFRSIEVYVYHRCAFEKPRNVDETELAAHELVVEVYPTLEQAVFMGVMNPGAFPSGTSTGVSETSSPGHTASEDTVDCCSSSVGGGGQMTLVPMGLPPPSAYIIAGPPSHYTWPPLLMPCIPPASMMLHPPPAIIMPFPSYSNSSSQQTPAVGTAATVEQPNCGGTNMTPVPCSLYFPVLYN
ncbi:hypothetical protein FOZ62_014340 [Perkinsus olseni]|uniref:Uncharacterized protein n=1 Tax=Perkinsus olseni TaxID=32597 RepID=A0A7J6R8I4_PEROL|nr:hypothetical protein FOZ62_014340 [Perkinsus olseni]